MGRMKRGDAFQALEVLKWMFPQDWIHFVNELELETLRLVNEGKVNVLPIEGEFKIEEIRIFTVF